MVGSSVSLRDAMTAHLFFPARTSSITPSQCKILRHHRRETSANGGSFASLSLSPPSLWSTGNNKSQLTATREPSIAVDSWWRVNKLGRARDVLVSGCVYETLPSTTRSPAAA